MFVYRNERTEQWAWSSGKKWDGPTVSKPKLNLYSAPPKAEMFQKAAKVSGGIGEKMLQKMGWNQGQGLGKTGAGNVNPIGFNEIKTDRKGLLTEDDKPKGAFDKPKEEEDSGEKVKSKYAVMKSSSFWSWHGAGMKGPESSKERIKVAKKEAKLFHQKNEPPAPLNLVGKHPTSALMEYCQKRLKKEPRFTEVRGPRGFRFKVEVGGQVYEPPEFSNNKKDAKKDCAQHCLVTMGLLPQ